MKAVLDGTVIAEALAEDVVRIEGNVYFPPASVRDEFLSTSPTPYTCPWKGECEYLDVTIGDQTLKDRAWRYPEPYPTAVERVGREFASYVAFWKEVEVVE